MPVEPTVIRVQSPKHPSKTSDKSSDLRSQVRRSFCGDSAGNVSGSSPPSSRRSSLRSGPESPTTNRVALTRILSVEEFSVKSERGPASCPESPTSVGEVRVGAAWAEDPQRIRFTLSADEDSGPAWGKTPSFKTSVAKLRATVTQSLERKQPRSTVARSPAAGEPHGSTPRWLAGAQRFGGEALKSKGLQTCMFACLLAALLMPDLWVLVDMSHNRDLDVILTLILLAFLFELILQGLSMGTTYFSSAFFWMDLLGALSLAFDLSYLPWVQASGDSDVASIMVTARIAKLGARAGRFTKLAKLLRFLPGVNHAQAHHGTASSMSRRLFSLISARVSVLIITMVIINPVFSIWTYPEDDFSMQTWLLIIERAGLQNTSQLPEQLGQLEQFYAQSGMGYFPYLLEYSFPSPIGVTAEISSWTPSAALGWRPPARAANVLRIEREHVMCMFNMSDPRRWEAGATMALTITAMLLMLGFSISLSASISSVVVSPLERLLDGLKSVAAKIFNSVVQMTDDIEGGEDRTSIDDSCETCDPQKETSVYTANSHVSSRGSSASSDNLGSRGDLAEEMELLERVMQKLTVLSEMMTVKDNTAHVSAEGLSYIGHHAKRGARGSMRNSTTSTFASEGARSLRSSSRMWSAASAPSLDAHISMMDSVGLTVDLVESWDMNPLILDKGRCLVACTFFFATTSHGMKYDPTCLSNFLPAIEDSYASLPYHNWYHAVDVLHSVFRWLRLLKTEKYLLGVERYALLVAAVCHDAGHPGLNNHFLVETSHELALRYNDKSPLENLHCSRLFEAARLVDQNIFSLLSKDDFQEVRNICVKSILHTDNAQHFQMIRDLQVFHEIHAEILQEQMEYHQIDPEDFPTKEAVGAFRPKETRQLIACTVLHASDISNPTKPFRICRIWAHQCLEEFFNQGDREKAAGIPVQSLNDREKVDRCYSQFGFIEFLVAPFSQVVLKIFPPYTPCAEQLVNNMRAWQDVWIAETKPAPTKQQQRQIEERIGKLEQRFMEEM